MATLRRRYQQPDTTTSEHEVLPVDTVCTILTRQSTMAQRDRHVFSAEVDPSVLIAEARRLGFAAARIRVLDWDMGKGAYNTTIEDRPALHHWLTQLLPSGESRVVLVSQEDRLFRDRTEIQVNRFIEQVAQHHGWVICGARVYNFRREMDKEQFRLACKYGKQYIEFHIKGRLHPARQRAAMQGRYTGGMVPWGYTVDYDAHSLTYKHYLRYPPYAVLVAEQVFARFARMERPTVTELARCWWREGLIWPFFGAEVDTRQVRWYDSNCQRDEQRGGYHFDPRQAQTILTNPVYLGWMVRKCEVARDGASGQPAACHEPLVDADLFWWCYDRILPQRPPFAPTRTSVVVAPYHARRSFTHPSDEVLFVGHGLVRCAQHGRRLSPFMRRQETRADVGQVNVRCWLHSGRKRELVEAQATECPVVPVAVVDEALCQSFAEQLQLDERDVEAVTHALAQVAQRREQAHAQGAAADVVTELERQRAEQQGIYDHAKRLALTAPDLAGDVVDELRQAKRTIADLETRIAAARVAVVPTTRAWQMAERAIDLAERIRLTFPHWSRQAQARILGMALEVAVLGRIDRYTLGLWMRWRGGSESRRHLVRPQGHRRDWTTAEDVALRAHFARLTREALCVMLPGRAWPSIRFRAYELGLSRPKGAVFSAVVPCVVPGPPTPNEMATYGFRDSAASSGDMYGSDA